MQEGIRFESSSDSRLDIDLRKGKGIYQGTYDVHVVKCSQKIICQEVTTIKELGATLNFRSA